MCFDSVKPFCTQDPSAISSDKGILPHFLSSLQTAVNNHTWINCCRCWIWGWGGRKRDRKNSLELIEKQQFVCMDCEFNCNDHVAVKGVIRPPINGGSIPCTKQDSIFTVHFGCLKVFTFSWALESTGCTKELQLPRNRSVCVWVYVRGRESMQMWWRIISCVRTCTDVYYVVWRKSGEVANIENKQKKAAIVFNQPGTLGINLAGVRVPDPTWRKRDSYSVLFWPCKGLTPPPTSWALSSGKQSFCLKGSKIHQRTRVLWCQCIWFSLSLSNESCQLGHFSFSALTLIWFHGWTSGFCGIICERKFCLLSFIRMFAKN